MTDILTPLPTELLHLLAYELRVLTPSDVLNLALTSQSLHAALLSSEFDATQHRATAGVHHCVARADTHAALLALSRGCGRLVLSAVHPAMTTLGLACQLGLADVVAALLRDPRIDPAANELEALMWATSNDRVDVMSLLLGDPRVDPTANDNEAIRVACNNGLARAAKVLLADARVDPSLDNNWDICYAAKRGLTELVAVLLADERVDPAAGNNKPVRAAAASGRTATTLLLIADPRVDAVAALRTAAKYGRVNVFSALLGHPRLDADLTIDACIEIGFEAHRAVHNVILADPRFIEAMEADEEAMRGL